MQHAHHLWRLHNPGSLSRPPTNYQPTVFPPLYGILQHAPFRPSLPPHDPAQLPQSDLDQLQLVSQLGVGGCAVVFRGRLGTLDCAIKLMEMPDVST